MTTAPTTKPCPFCNTTAGTMSMLAGKVCRLCNDTNQVPADVMIPPYPKSTDSNPWRDIKTDPPKAEDFEPGGFQSIEMDGAGGDNTVSIGSPASKGESPHRKRWRHTQSWLDARKPIICPVGGCRDEGKHPYQGFKYCDAHKDRGEEYAASTQVGHSAAHKFKPGDEVWFMSHDKAVWDWVQQVNIAVNLTCTNVFYCLKVIDQRPVEEALLFPSKQALLESL